MSVPAQKISIEQAKVDKLFYVVVTVIPFRESDRKVLLLKRSDTEKVHPGKWGIPGGKLEHQDIDVNNPDHMNGIVKDYHSTLFELAQRETQEESGLNITDNLKFVSSKVFIRPDETPVVLLQFIAPVDEAVTEVVLEEGAFSDFAWVSESELDEYDCIDGIPQEVRQGIALF